MANFKRKRRKYSTACGLCKAYKKAGNGSNRTMAKEKFDMKLYCSIITV